MASEEASRRASVASSSDLSFPDSTTAGKLLPKKEKPNVTSKLKKSITKKAKETDSNGGSTSPSSPLIKVASVKSGDDRSTCKHCKKPVDSVHFDSHVSVCLEKKKENARKKKERKEAKQLEASTKPKEQPQVVLDKDKDGDSVMGNTGPRASQDGGDGDRASVNGDVAAFGLSSQVGTGVKKPPKKSATKSAPGDKKTKKRKAEAEAAEKEPKKKKTKKDEDKPSGPKAPKPPKPKGPVNVEIQCGVPLDPEKGGFCARSLTCKSHSMGLKRAVPGRSLPYDQLLANYQKKNHAKQQKALMEAQSGAHPADEEDADGAAVDSDEEKEAVMKGLTRWKPRPLEQVVTVGVRKRYQYVRLKEALGSALAGTVGQRLFGVPAMTAPTTGNEGFVDGVDAATEGPQRTMSITSESGRKASVGGASGGQSAGQAHSNISRGLATSTGAM